jgi:hypothetical protein
MEKVSFREIPFLLKMSRDLQMPFAAITHLVEGLSLETFLTLKVKESMMIMIMMMMMIIIIITTTVHKFMLFSYGL